MVRRPADDDEHAGVTLRDDLWSAGFKLVALYGAPTAISLGLVVWLAVKIDRDLNDRQREHAGIMQQVEHLDDALLDNRAVMLREVDRIRGMLYRICVNTARTDHDLAVCNYSEEPDATRRPAPQR